MSNTLLLFILRWLGFTLVSWLRGLSRDEEREKVVYDVSGCNTRDVCMVVCRCDFDNVRAAEERGECQVSRARVTKMQKRIVHEVEARKAPDDTFDLARCPATRFWCSSYKRIRLRIKVSTRFSLTSWC
jgi:hypothetical protein